MDGVKRIQTTLTDGGMLVYDPGAHPDVCSAAYIVVRPMGTYPTAESSRLGYRLVNVILYVPLDDHDQLDTMNNQVKELLDPLRSQIRPTGNVGADMIEAEYKAHSRSLEYMILKRL